MDKKYIYVDAEIADKIEKLESIDAIDDAVRNLLKARRKEMLDTLDSQNYDLDSFKASCLEYRRAIEQCYSDELTLLEKSYNALYEKAQKIREMRAKIEQVTTEARDDVYDLQRSIDDLSIHGMRNLLDMVENINELDTQTKTLLTGLFIHYNGENNND